MKTLAQAGLTADAVARLIAHHRRCHGAAWRRHFWTVVVRETNARYAASA